VVGRAGGPVCKPEAPARWTGAPRARVVAALSSVPRPFAAWEAERVAAALDAAVDALGAAEAAPCRRETPGHDGGAACIAQRTAALAALLTATSSPGAPAASSSPLDDPWPLVRQVEHCDAAVDPALAELRGKLRGATAAQAGE